VLADEFMMSLAGVLRASRLAPCSSTLAIDVVISLLSELYHISRTDPGSHFTGAEQQTNAFKVTVSIKQNKTEV
jgi:hypothetical protein